ncbi:MAG: c-type cytochrome [Bacteroidetes bacterium]|nr:c-type cytochrome [Bacteroidota bacterium]
MIYKRLNYSILVLLFTFSLSALFAQDQAAVEAGKALFKNNCASCHNKNMKDKLTGPALGGAQERWGDDEALYKWIRNSQAEIASGHPRAVAIWNEFKPTVMTSFPSLSDGDIANILAYINCTAAGNCPGNPPPPPVDGGNNAGAGNAAGNNNLLYVFLFLILALLAVILSRIISNLNHISAVKELGADAPARKSLAEILTSKGVVSFAIFAVILFGGYFTVRNAINLGRQQGYQPTQPIKFSHATHAGVNKIDCNYCHDGARRSKHSVIPAANTCMNCHKAIKVGSTYGTAELTKIYASIGFDPKGDTLIKDYDKKTDKEIEAIYKGWISENYIKEKNTMDAEGEALLASQWDGIVASLTDKKSGDTKIQGPIEWIRIHNLPDHVFFSHQQHVSVGKVACQTCHGKVEEMDEVKQYAPLSMGWCINCHRQTEVKFADNKYYDNYYEMYHKQMENNERSKVTVEDIGGTECQKCHY